jgi:prolipoprotein diacylglyceryltransferase
MAMAFLFSSSSHSYFFPLHTTFLYQAIWQHPSALALLFCSSAFCKISLFGKERDLNLPLLYNISS